MTRINLYPWRLAKELQSKKQFLVILILSVAATVFFVLSKSWYVSNEIDNQLSNNEYINQEVIKVNQKLREISAIRARTDAILARLAVLQKLDSDRYSTIYIVNEVIELINPLVVLDKITRDKDIVKISGYSESNSGVAKFLRAIELSPNFHSAELNEIRVLDESYNDSGFQNYFQMRFVQKNVFDNNNDKQPVDEG